MDSIEKLKNLFKKFPTVGARTASRFVYHLIKLPDDKIEEFINSVRDLKKSIKLCRFCFNPYELKENDSGFCRICKEPGRDKNCLCVVEKEADLLTIENTKKYKGFYFILGGTVAVMRKEDVSNLRLEELKSRAKAGNFSEIIIALNPTPEGKITSVLIENALKEVLNPVPKITRLAKGIPVGGELEYADEETLESAFEGRK